MPGIIPSKPGVIRPCTCILLFPGIIHCPIQYNRPEPGKYARKKHTRNRYKTGQNTVYLYLSIFARFQAFCCVNEYYIICKSTSGYTPGKIPYN